MTGWDISVSGVEFVTSLVQDAMDEMAKDVKSYGKHMESAVASAGTVSGPTCGVSTPTGPVGAALSTFVYSTTKDVLFLNARAAKSVNGAREAMGCYLQGNLEMAAHAQEAALAVPKIDMPGKGAGGGGAKGGEQ
ncbi:DUF6507 family protein [Streptomyces sp. DH24]|uniref:DUF6507 family protein n=1 Tax=Streptomyces sp. DH24 TaxID=3040123 RepID=UPI00244170CC|nr:DUF6507 family protein [Streptomyces sp. DH24]MDG9718722.1 DUF6507 family protein [Streptomyces sp. DH24]